MSELELFDRSRLEESGRMRFLRQVVLAGRPAFCACMHLVAGMVHHFSLGPDGV